MCVKFARMFAHVGHEEHSRDVSRAAGLEGSSGTDYAHNIIVFPGHIQCVCFVPLILYVVICAPCFAAANFSRESSA
ncbi:MAG: hypothetical protein IIY20_00220 [Bifidobacteriaceae bacterium]|nr:hypothetical protein [Bifidobacteriaceae bacterium]